MRNIVIALALLAGPLTACATNPPLDAHLTPAQERMVMREVVDAYRAAYEAYAAAEQRGAWSPAQRAKALEALGVAWTGLAAARSAFEADHSPTFLDQATAARKLAEAARAAALA
jgi:hypothetical protein